MATFSTRRQFLKMIGKDDMKKDSLGNRMKSNYEDITRFYLPKRTHTIIRVDGKAFHTITKNMKRPFDLYFMCAMAKTALNMCQQIQGVIFAYVQSDEISLLLTDYNKITTQTWFGGNLQKMCSVSAGIATYYFNKHITTLMRPSEIENSKSPIVFDSRVFTIPDPVEVENYFIWRQQDATRNSLQSVTQSHYSHKELHGKDASQLHDMIHDKEDNWSNYSIPCKRGTMIQKYIHHANSLEPKTYFERNNKIPIFTQDRNYLRSLIPTRED